MPHDFAVMKVFLTKNVLLNVSNSLIPLFCKSDMTHVFSHTCLPRPPPFTRNDSFWVSFLPVIPVQVKWPCPFFLRICYCRCILGICIHSEGYRASWSWGCPSGSMPPGWPPRQAGWHQRTWPALVPSDWAGVEAVAPWRGEGAEECSGTGGRSSVRDALQNREEVSHRNRWGRRRHPSSDWLDLCRGHRGETLGLNEDKEGLWIKNLHFFFSCQSCSLSNEL